MKCKYYKFTIVIQPLLWLVNVDLINLHLACGHAKCMDVNDIILPDFNGEHFDNATVKLICKPLYNDANVIRFILPYERSGMLNISY